MDNRLKRTMLLICVVVVVATGTHELNAQDTTANECEQIGFSQYLNLAEQNNLRFIAAKYDVKIAQAQAISQRIFPDPEFTVSAFDNSERTLELGRGVEFEIGYNLELGGKRNSRIRLAKSEAEMVSLFLESSFREFRADAALLFLESLKQKEFFKLKEEAFNSMKQLYEYDSLRYKAGEINETEMLRTKIETASLLNKLYVQDAAFKSSMAALNEFAGLGSGVLLMPQGDMAVPQKEYLLQELYAAALNNRADLTIAMKQKEISSNQLKLTKAERTPDIKLNVGYSINTEAKNEIAPVPAFNSVQAGITVPLRFSNANKGSIMASQYTLEQSELKYKAAELQIQKEITQAFFYYAAVKKQFLHYNQTILDDAKKIYEGTQLKYQRGETSLLEVFAARHTYREIRENYVETLFNYASSIVELNRKSGIWGVRF